MKKLTFCTLLILLLTAVAAADAQSPVRVKCNCFTMNVPSANVSCYQVEGNIPAPDGAAPGDVAAAQVANSSLHISDYERGGHAFSPRVTIYAQENLIQTSLTLLDQVSLLSDALENVRSGYADVRNIVNDVPFLPYQASSRLGNTLAKYLDFENGSGIRLITAFPNDNGSGNLIYSFQGLTSDQRYYISAVIPLYAASVNQASADTDWSSMQEGDFSPSLETLDFYMQSIVIDN